MRRILSVLILSAILTGCSSISTRKNNDLPNQVPETSRPILRDSEIRKADNFKLCQLYTVGVDPRVDEEIKIRKLYCDQAELVCREKGLVPNSLAMIDCVYDNKLKNQSPDVKYCFESGVAQGDINGMTGCLIKRAQLETTQHKRNYL